MRTDARKGRADCERAGAGVCVFRAILLATSLLPAAALGGEGTGAVLGEFKTKARFAADCEGQ